MHKLLAMLCLVVACGAFTARARAQDAAAEVDMLSFASVSARLDNALRTADRPERLASIREVLSGLGYDLTFAIPDVAADAGGNNRSGAAAEPQILPLDFAATAPAFPSSKVFQAEMRLAQSGPARLIVLSHGNYTLTGLAEAMTLRGNNGLIAIEEGKASINLPIYIGPGANLMISSRDAADVRLNAAAGAFIVAAGTLIIDGAQVSSAKLEVRRRPDDERTFNSFLLVGAGGTFQARNASFARLGSSKLQAFGVGLFNTSAESSIVGSIFSATYGLLIEDSQGVGIAGNEFSWVSGTAIHIVRSSHTRVSGNLIYGAANGAGILLGSDARASEVSGNIILRNRTGISTAMDGGGNVIENNAIIASAGPGIGLAGVNCNVVRDNDLLANRNAGVAWRGGPAQLLGNRIAFNQLAGVTSPRDGTAGAIAPGDLLLKGNHFSRNRTGVRVDMADSITLENNSFSKQSPRLISGRLGSEIGAIMAAGAEPVRFTRSGEAAFAQADAANTSGCTIGSANQEIN